LNDYINIFLSKFTHGGLILFGIASEYYFIKSVRSRSWQQYTQYFSSCVLFTLLILVLTSVIRKYISYGQICMWQTFC